MTLLLGFLAALAAAPTPYLAKVIIDDFIFQEGGESATSGWFGLSQTLWMIAGIVGLGILLKLLSSLLGGWQCHYILQITRNSLFGLRLATAEALMGARQEAIDRIEPGRIASRLGLDINQIDGATFTLLRNAVTSAFTLVVVLGFMLWLDVLLTLVVLATMPATAALSVWSYRKLMEFNREESDRSAALTASCAEIFGALRVIRVFTAEAFFLARLRDRSEAMRFEGIRHWTIFHAINLLLVLLGSLGGDIFLLVGGVLAIEGSITFGDFFAFYGYQAMLWGPVAILLGAGQQSQIGTASAEKVDELLQISREPYLDLPATPADMPFTGHIEAKNLCFSYRGGEPVLRDLTFEIRPGTVTALVGQSGSGKTTLASLFTGLILPTDGTCLIDGLDISRWDLRELRRHMGVVLQDSILFNDTLHANLCMGTEHADERIWAALAAAHADGFVRKLPSGLDERIGADGVSFSGGQRQRLAIARVFLKDPAFLVLDEATSALDSETEKAIQRSFEALLAGRTSVVIAHRLSTIYRADQILVLHQGRLVESGTHEDLVGRAEGHYRELFEAQVEGMIPLSGATRRPWNREQRA